MQYDISLQLLNNSKIEAAAARPFEPDDNEIEVITAEGREKITFPLSEVACVFLDNKPAKIAQNDAAENQEEVETVCGDRFNVRVPGSQDYQTGFFGLPIAENHSWQAVFFTFLGVRTRRPFNPIGKILTEKGLISQTDIDVALAEQKKIKERKLGEVIAAKHNVSQKSINDAIKRMMQRRQGMHRARIGDILVAAGLITKGQLDEALAAQTRDKKKPLGAMLVERGLLTENQVLTALASKFGLKFIDLDEVEIDDKAVAAISPEIVRQFQVMPIRDKGNHIEVAISEPLEHVMVGSVLRFHANRGIEIVVANPRQILAAIEMYYADSSKGEDAAEDLIFEMSEDVNVEEEDEEAEATLIKESDSKIIRLVNKILLDGYQKKASDIHVEPGMGRAPVQVRYRVDGICQVSHKVARMYKRALISRLKILSNLDITEHRKPQSGKIIMRFNDRKLEFRLEVTPTIGGQEDAVIRVLPSVRPMSLEELGFSSRNQAVFEELLAKPYGMILCVGPTGSGKTSTLHSALAHLNTPDRKIWTAEDPVEITQPGLRQVQVLPKIGFNFEDALRSFLRADPDVIMIGEIRDRETARTTIEASLTGHLVFSTLHTNTAPETLVRLLEMGVEAYNFADALLGVLAQRLTGRLCDCKEIFQPERVVYDELIHAYGEQYVVGDEWPSYSEEFRMARVNGCKKCNMTGYHGRRAIHELLIGTIAVKNAIKEEKSAEEIKGLAMADGMRTLKMDGITKVLRLETDMEQINRVCI